MVRPDMRQCMFRSTSRMLLRAYPHCPSTAPKPFVEAPSHTTQGFEHTPHGLIKKGRSLPTTGLHLVGFPLNDASCGAAMERWATMNLIYPAPNSR